MSSDWIHNSEIKYVCFVTFAYYDDDDHGIIIF